MNDDMKEETLKLLEQIAEGIGGELLPFRDNQNRLDNAKKIFIAPFTTIFVRVGGWRMEGRISFSAFIEGRYQSPPRISVSQNRSAEALINDIKRRLLDDAKEYCREALQVKSQYEMKQTEQRAVIDSILEAVGSDYEEALCSHNDSFRDDCFSFRSQDVSDQTCRIELTTSTPCMRLILAIVKQERIMKKKSQEQAEREYHRLKAERLAKKSKTS